jgi:hypothetical protein
MLTLSEELKKRRGTCGMFVRKCWVLKGKGSKTPYVAAAFGWNILVEAGLDEAKRIDAFLKNGNLEFFEAVLPGAGWALTKMGRGKTRHFRMPYKEGLPFILNDETRYKVKVLVIDAEKKTITIATTIEESIDDGNSNRS